MVQPAKVKGQVNLIWKVLSMYACV